MKRYLLFVPALVWVALAACNGSGGSSDNADGDTTGNGLDPTAIATEISPPTSGQLPSELLPPS